MQFAPKHHFFWLFLRFLAMLLFELGFNQVDQRQPYHDGALAYYLVAAAICFATILLTFRTEGVGWKAGLAAMVLALPFGIAFATGLEYNQRSIIYFSPAFLYAWVAVSVLLIPAILFVIFAARNAEPPMPMVGTATLWLVFSAGIVVLYHLMTLDQQVAAAEQAHARETPGLGILAAIALFGFLAWRTRTFP